MRPSQNKTIQHEEYEKVIVWVMMSKGFSLKDCGPDFRWQELAGFLLSPEQLWDLHIMSRAEKNWKRVQRRTVSMPKVVGNKNHNAEKYLK